MITVENVSFRYEDETAFALKNITMHIDDGEFVAIIGHNGCGKSTLSKLFNALLLPTKGDVFVDGMNTKDEQKTFEIRKNAGMIFQNPDNQMVATLVEEEIAFGPENLGVPRDEIRRRVDAALQAVHMQEYKRFKPHQLSGGQKQRIAIASVMAMEPKCIIFDEATAMLDPKGRREVLSTIDTLRGQGVSIVYITHYMEEITRADRVIVLNDGEIYLEATPRELCSQIDKLRAIDLDVSQVAYMAYALQKQGLPLPGDIMEPVELVEALCRLK